MARTYSYEKGKYHMVTGTIIPFARYLDGVDPQGPDWTSYVPAGFLRCDGKIYKARDFRALADVLGTGAASKFKKTGVTLEEVNESLTLGQFQLPDLGSKYISAATANGTYNELYVTNPITNALEKKVGVAVELSINQTPVEMRYTGNFSVPATSIDFPSIQNFGITIANTVGTEGITSENLLAHGHFSNAVVVRDGPYNGYAASGGGATSSATDADVITSDFTSVGGSDASTQHNHQLQHTNPTRSTVSNISAFSVNPSEIVTSVTLNKTNLYKLDDAQHKFILVEYLIKI